MESDSTNIPPSALKRLLATASSLWARAAGYVPVPVRSFVSGHKILSGVVLGGTILLVFGYLALTSEPQPEIITEIAKRGTITQTVEAVGTLSSERDLNLQFPVSGVVAEVLVKEGDTVTEKQRIASLRSTSQQANVNGAYARVQSDQARLREMQEGSRPEDIAIAEAEVENKKAQLQAAQEDLASAEQKLTVLQEEASVSLAGYVTTARSTISQRLTTASTTLTVMEDVLDDNDVQDAMTRSDPSRISLVKRHMDEARTIVSDHLVRDVAFSDHHGALSSLQSARIAITAAGDIAEEVFTTIATIEITPYFTRENRETRKTDLSTEKANIQTALSAIDAQIKELQDASAGFDTRIATEQSTITSARGNILSLESSLRTQDAQLALKRAGSRQTDIDAAAANVRQSQADLQKAQASLEDTVLVAPVAGSITKVNIKTGELLSTAFQQEAAVTMLGTSPYRIEMFVSEIDIPKVQTGQAAQVQLDAFPNQPFPLTVAEVDPAATDIDGVPKYRIKLDFTETDPGFKIGMTGDVDIFTGKREDVIVIPARAIIEDAQGRQVVRVFKEDGTFSERTVDLGLEGENDIEVVSGIAEGEKIVILVKK